jgi:hypothetical protein
VNVVIPRPGVSDRQRSGTEDRLAGRVRRHLDHERETIELTGREHCRLALWIVRRNRQSHRPVAHGRINCVYVRAEHQRITRSAVPRGPGVLLHITHAGRQRHRHRTRPAMRDRAGIDDVHDQRAELACTRRANLHPQCGV